MNVHVCTEEKLLQSYHLSASQEHIEPRIDNWPCIYLYKMWYPCSMKIENTVKVGLQLVIDPQIRFTHMYSDHPHVQALIN